MEKGEEGMEKGIQDKSGHRQQYMENPEGLQHGQVCRQSRDRCSVEDEMPEQEQIKGFSFRFVSFFVVGTAKVHNWSKC